MKPRCFCHRGNIKTVAAGTCIVSMRAVSRLVDQHHLHGDISVHTASLVMLQECGGQRAADERAAVLAHGHGQQKVHIHSRFTPRKLPGLPGHVTCVYVLNAF